MSEALARNKKVRAGHRSSATRLMHQLEGEYEIDDGPTLDRLMQCKLSLNQKLDKIRELDEEILALVDDDGIENEIEQADQFKERIQQAIIRVEHKISAREQPSVVSPPSSHRVTTLPDTGAPVDTTPVSSSHHIITSSDVPTPAHHSTTAIPDTNTTVVTSATVTPVPHHAVSEISISKVKLPKLEPKKFNGDLTKFFK